MKNILSLIILAILGVSAFAQDKTLQPYSLQQAVSYALQNNYNIKNAKLSEAQAKAKNYEILTTGLPQINGNFDYSYAYKPAVIPAINRVFAQFAPPGSGETPSITFVFPHTVGTGFQLSQLIFDARYLIGVKATKDLLATSRYTTQLSEQDIKYNVMKAYYQAEAAQEAKGLLQDNMTIIDKLLSDTRKTFEQGLIEELDVNRLELAKATLESQIAMQARLSEVALANLKYQMGLPLGDQIILTDKLTSLKTAANISVDSKFDIQNRVEYDLLTTGIKLRGYDLKQKQSGYYPYLVGFLNYSWNAQTTKFGEIFSGFRDQGTNGEIIRTNPWYQSGMAGISLKIPIFDSGLKGAQVKQAKLELQKTQNQFDDFKNAAQLQFDAAQSTLNSAIADEAISTKTIELSKKIFERNEIKFKSGVGSSFELQQTQQEYATNQLKYIQSVVSLLNAKADLDKAMGVK